jgi:hypothetical protein
MPPAQTGRGKPAARSEGFYQPDPPAEPVRGADGSLQVAFAGEDGRTFVYSFARLLLAGMHEPLAVAFAARTGPAGGRRTLASARVTWQAITGMLRFLAALPRPPQDLAELTRSHLERLRRLRLLTKSPLCVTNEMTEIFLLPRHADQQLLQPEVRELICQRGHHLGKYPKKTGLPGYSDREYTQIMQAARRQAAQIRDLPVRADPRLPARPALARHRRQDHPADQRGPGRLHRLGQRLLPAARPARPPWPLSSGPWTSRMPPLTATTST